MIMTVDLVANPGKATYVAGGQISRNARYAPVPEPERKVTWRDQANCRDVDNPEIFYPDPSDDEAHAEIIAEYCDGCPVKAECLAADLAVPGPRWGIRGGLSAAQREPQKSTTGRPPLTECRQGHPYTQENTTTDGRGHRRCIACLNADRERRKAQRREAP